MDRRTEIDSLVEHVKSWAFEDRVALAYEILRDMRLKPIGDPPRRTLERAIGVARGDGPTPSDDEVRRWLDEAKAEKYGG